MLLGLSQAKVWSGSGVNPYLNILIFMERFCVLSLAYVVKVVKLELEIRSFKCLGVLHWFKHSPT